jgi:arylsulfatase
MGFPRILSSFVLIVALFSMVSCQAPEEKTRKPNIILILADDLGYGEVGVYGQKKIATPHIDALAQNGMRFTQHYSGAPVCAPSRYILMTGKHAGHAYVRGNDEWGERGEVWDYAKAVDDPNLEGQRPIPTDTVTVGKLLQQVGYKTAVIGKWGLGAPLTESVPNAQGFDFFYGYNCQRQAHTYFPRHLWKNREKVWLDNELVVPGTKLPEGADPLDPESYQQFYLKDYSPDLMFEEVVQFVERNQENPFFLYFATPIPHVALQAPEKWVQHYVEKFGDEEPYLGDRGYFPHRNPRAAYAGMVSYLDDQVGQLVAKLIELGIYQDTLILFTSDNGPSYAGGADPEFFDSAQPFKSEYGYGKGFVHEGGIRVPMIASWPGRIMPGSETDHISVFYDLLPTFCEIAGVKVPEKTDGLSFVPTLLGTDQQARHSFLYWEFPSYNGQQAVRLGNWKGIRKNIFDGNVEVELYNLESDIQELNNVASEHPDIVKEIEAIMQREHIPSEVERFQFEALGDKQ